jgi:uncharacterized lipoprotein YajG
MKRTLLIAAIVALAGCQTTPAPPPTPSPEMLALQQACQNGNLQACATAENLRTQQEAARQAALATVMASGAMTTYQAPYIQPLPPLQPYMIPTN